MAQKFARPRRCSWRWTLGTINTGIRTLRSCRLCRLVMQRNFCTKFWPPRIRVAAQVPHQKNRRTIEDNDCEGFANTTAGESTESTAPWSQSETLTLWCAEFVWWTVTNSYPMNCERSIWKNHESKRQYFNFATAKNIKEDRIPAWFQESLRNSWEETVCIGIGDTSNIFLGSFPPLAPSGPRCQIPSTLKAW